MPPKVFGVPTIYIDMHPQTHERMSTRYDHILRKRIFYIKENRFLNNQEIFEDRHIAAQSENRDFVKSKGYEVMSCDLDKLNQSISDMILFTGSEYRNDWKKSEKESYLNSLKKMLTNGEYLKFEFGSKSY